MGKRRSVWLIVLLIVGFFFPVTPALADGEPPEDGAVIWNEDYLLDEGEQLDGDLVVFNGDVNLRVESRVRGDTVVWNGDADVAGVLEGDLVVSSGDIYLEETARVAGDVVCTWNCDIERSQEAQVDGRVVEGISLRGFPFEDWDNFPWPSIPEPTRLSFWVSGPKRLLEWFLKAVRSLVTVLVVSVIGALVALIWPDATAQVGQTAFEAAGPSLGIGLLTSVAGTALVIALAITICLSPMAGLLALALGAAGLFGWIAVGAWVGRRLFRATKAFEGEIEPMWAAGVGTLAITLVSVGLSLALCLAPFGWLLTFGLGSLGLGAVVLTRFGTMSYTPGQREQPTTPAPPAPAEAPPAPQAAAPPGSTVEGAREGEEKA